MVITLSQSINSATLPVFNQSPLIEGDAEVLFGPFRSTHMEEGRDHQGLGLYLVRLVAEHYGGAGKLANRPDDEGVEASISLQLASIDRFTSSSQR